MNAGPVLRWLIRGVAIGAVAVALFMMVRADLAGPVGIVVDFVVLVGGTLFVTWTWILTRAPT